VDGIHIDRSKNLSAENYEHRQMTKDKQVFDKMVSKQSAFEKIIKQKDD
jgi:hypothetical protein